jgi:tetratricopeptide (TPR) repeat protein
LPAQAFAKGDWQLALEHYTAALRLEPSNSAAQNNRAMAYLKINRFADAAADCTAVLQTSPSNVKALLRRATAFQSMGQLQEAVADLRQVLHLEANNADAASRLAAIEKSQQ